MQADLHSQGFRSTVTTSRHFHFCFVWRRVLSFFWRVLEVNLNSHLKDESDSFLYKLYKKDFRTFYRILQPRRRCVRSSTWNTLRFKARNQRTKKSLWCQRGKNINWGEFPQFPRICEEVNSLTAGISTQRKKYNKYKPPRYESVKTHTHTQSQIVLDSIRWYLTECLFHFQKSGHTSYTAGHLAEE